MTGGRAFEHARLRAVVGLAVAVSGIAILLSLGAAASRGGVSAPHDGLIAFMRPGQVGEYDLWVVRPNGQGLRRLTTAPRDRSDYNPTWSADGATVLFERRGDESGENLYTVPALGGTPAQLGDCSGDCWSNGEARWSPDGSKVAFSRATGPRTAPGPSRVAINVMDSNGSNLLELSKPPNGYEDHYPSWAADGQTIIFQRDTSTTTPGATKLLAIDVATRTERPFYALPPWAPGSGIATFSRDGKRILFGYWCIYSDACPASTRSLRNSRLATLRSDGKQLRVMPLKLRADSGAWAPSGTQIVFRCTRELTGSFQLCISRLDGSHLKQFPWQLSSGHPSWGTHS
jgi:Tol biopolymer transport system component